MEATAVEPGSRGGGAPWGMRDEMGEHANGLSEQFLERAYIALRYDASWLWCDEEMPKGADEWAEMFRRYAEKTLFLQRGSYGRKVLDHFAKEGHPQYQDAVDAFSHVVGRGMDEWLASNAGSRLDFFREHLWNAVYGIEDEQAYLASNIYAGLMHWLRHQPDAGIPSDEDGWAEAIRDWNQSGVSHWTLHDARSRANLVYCLVRCRYIGHEEHDDDAMTLAIARGICDWLSRNDASALAQLVVPDDDGGEGQVTAADLGGDAHNRRECLATHYQEEICVDSEYGDIMLVHWCRCLRCGADWVMNLTDEWERWEQSKGDNSRFCPHCGARVVGVLHA